MAEGINPILRLYEDQYNADGYSSVNHIAKGLMTESDMLSTYVTHLYYSQGSNKFPLSFLTEGMGRTKAIKSTDLSYKTPIMGRVKTDSTIASSLYASSDKPGLNGNEFIIPFADKWFKANQVLQSKDQSIQVHVKRQPEKVGNVYHYYVTLFTGTKADFCPVDLLQAGVKWAGGIVKVGIENSVGTEQRSQSPGEMTNQLSVVRDTFKVRGNVSNKVMVVEIPTDEGPKKYWSEFEYYLRNLEWKETCENDLWYSRYNRTSDGQILTTDEQAGDAFVPSGAGALQQIPNEDTYSIMTEKKLSQIMRNAFFNASDADTVQIEVFTGTGGLEEVDKAMKEGAKGFTIIQDNTNFIRGNDPSALAYGAYFKEYQHVDGHNIKFRYLPMLDKGRFAKISDPHPETGLPLESYSMYFMDMSQVDGEANIQYVSEEGRENIEFVVPGAAKIKGYTDAVQGAMRATSRDASTVEFMKTQGIAIKRPTNCFKVYCKAN